MNRVFFWTMILLLHGVGLFGALALLPDSREKTTMMVRDADYTGARTSLQGLFAAGDRRKPILMELFRLHVENGDRETAAPVIEAYVKDWPDDIEGHEVLARFYEDGFDADGLVRELETLMRLQPVSSTFRRLLEEYRLAGRYDDERQFLMRWRRASFFRTEDRERLGLLQLAAGRMAEALTALRDMDDRRGRELAPVGEAALFDALLGTGQIEEAFRRARGWAQRADEATTLDVIVGKLRQAEQERLALDLVLGVSQPDANLALTAAELLIGAGRMREARDRLAALAEGGEALDSGKIERFVPLAVAAGDVRLAVETALRAGPGQVPQRALASLVAHLVDDRQAEFLWMLKPALDEATLARNPLLAARLALIEGRRDDASTRLGEVHVERLAPAEQLGWLDLSRRLGAEQPAYARMSVLWRGRRLPRELMPAYAEMSEKQGRSGVANEVFAELGGRFPVKGTEAP